MASRKIKKEIYELLNRNDVEAALAEIDAYAPNQVVGPLFTHFYHGGIVRWRAITAMGRVVSGMAERGEIESARIVMRRLMWNLNDESGGIGWGSPEAMGEIMARNRQLAEEFHCILTSYAWEEGNYLEHERLQRGVLWGLGRLSHARPEMIRYAADFLVPFIDSDDPFHRGLAVWAAGPIATDAIRTKIGERVDDTGMLRLYTDGHLRDISVGELAKAASVA